MREGTVSTHTQVSPHPCPFCGCGDPSVGSFRVECLWCNTRGPSRPSREEAIASWNSRHKDAKIAELKAMSEHRAKYEVEIARLQEAVRLVESALMRDLTESGESVTAELLGINWIERPEVQRAIGATNNGDSY